MNIPTVIAGRRAQTEKRGNPLSFFEFWPGWLFYAPVIAHWLLLGLRYGDFSLPTAANPRITTGGLCGELKLSILGLVGRSPGGAEAQALVAPACGVLARPDGVDAAEAAMQAFGLSYPIVVKPDIGCNGAGVRLVRDRDALAKYLHAFPAGETVVLQHYVPEPNEAGIFYVRHPDEPAGKITSLTIKQPPVVVGDGRSTLRDLILADERARLVPHLYLDRLADRLDQHSGARGGGATGFRWQPLQRLDLSGRLRPGDAGPDQCDRRGWLGRCRISIWPHRRAVRLDRLAAAWHRIHR